MSRAWTTRNPRSMFGLWLRVRTLIVSLGVDTYEHDPISQFRITTDDFPRIGDRIAALRCATLFVMEGGYAVEDIGVNAVNVLAGFEAG